MLTLTTNIQHMIDAHSEELCHLRKKCESLEKDNASLKETNKRLGIKLTELKTAALQLSSTNQPNASLVIGSSMVRDIDADKLLDTEVICLPGGHIKDVHDYLRKSHITFKDVAILFGGNDCAAWTNPEPVEELLNNYKDMAVEANRLTRGCTRANRYSTNSAGNW